MAESAQKRPVDHTGVQNISTDHVPKTSSEGVELKLYSGSLAGISSPVKNHVPVIIADIQMQPDTSYSLNLPASYSTFLYVLDGGLQIGEEKKSLEQNQVGWLDRSTINGDSELNLSAGKSGARFVLYAGQPRRSIVSHGPFIADTQEDISRLYREFRSGENETYFHSGRIAKIQLVSAAFYK
ncbi:MAG: pirin-like C-terminal cupin domain-containing protein [Puia sp.]